MSIRRDSRFCPLLLLRDLISDRTCFVPRAYIESLVLHEKIFDSKKKNEDSPPHTHQILLLKYTPMLIWDMVSSDYTCVFDPKHVPVWYLFDLDLGNWKSSS